jgi:FMN-dependent NADH-azoreductase
MTHVLQLHSSLSGESGQSSRLASEFAAALSVATGATVLERIDQLAA